MIDTTRLNPQEWAKPAEISSKPPPKSMERILSNKLKAMVEWNEEQRKMEGNIYRHLQIPNNSWNATQLN